MSENLSESEREQLEEWRDDLANAGLMEDKSREFDNLSVKQSLNQMGKIVDMLRHSLDELLRAGELDVDAGELQEVRHLLYDNKGEKR